MNVRRLYHRVYHWPYTPGQLSLRTTVAASSFPSPASGCKGLSSLRSSTPCPSAFSSPPLVSSRDWDASLSLAKSEGQGLPPLHPRAVARPLAREKLSPPNVRSVRPLRHLHSTQGSVCSRCSGASSGAYISVPLFSMKKLIERSLFKVFGWWKWKRRFRNSQLPLNAFIGDQIRIIVSEPINGADHLLHLERLGYDKQWRRFGSIAEKEFPELLSLLVDSGNFIRSGALRWKVVDR